MPVIPDYIPAHEQSLKLSRQNAIMLVHALDEPAKKHPRLQQAADRYDLKHTKT